jgi:microcystin-dependent protein
MSLFALFDEKDTLDAKALNKRFQELDDALNGLAAFPTGSIISLANSAVPNGWLYCNGSAVNRATYAALFGVIDTTYGVGDGSTTFNLPDLRGRTVIGSGQGAGLTNRILTQLVGEENHQLTIPEIAAHTHPNAQGVDGIAGAGGASGDATNTASSSAGSDTPHNNMQPSLVLTPIIKT